LLVLAAGSAGAATPPDSPASLDELRRDRRMADDLYKATTSDAATFEKALATPALRSELEQAMNRAPRRITGPPIGVASNR
jgi:hypothetical protein